MIKFKPGDRVIVLPHEPIYLHPPFGTAGTVLTTEETPYVKMDEDNYNIFESYQTDCGRWGIENCNMISQDILELINSEA